MPEESGVPEATLRLPRRHHLNLELFGLPDSRVPLAVVVGVRGQSRDYFSSSALFQRSMPGWSYAQARATFADRLQHASEHHSERHTWPTELWAKRVGLVSFFRCNVTCVPGRQLYWPEYADHVVDPEHGLYATPVKTTNLVYLTPLLRCKRPEFPRQQPYCLDPDELPAVASGPATA